jgi:hypothetical protein
MHKKKELGKASAWNFNYKSSCSTGKNFHCNMSCNVHLSIIINKNNWNIIQLSGSGLVIQNWNNACSSTLPWVPQTTPGFASSLLEDYLVQVDMACLLNLIRPSYHSRFDSNLKSQVPVPPCSIDAPVASHDNTIEAALPCNGKIKSS